MKGVGKMENGEVAALNVKEAHTVWKSRSFMLRVHKNYFSTRTRKRKEQRNSTLGTYCISKCYVFAIKQAAQTKKHSLEQKLYSAVPVLVHQFTCLWVDWKTNMACCHFNFSQCPSLEAYHLLVLCNTTTDKLSSF